MAINTNELMKLIELANARIRHHHDTLWKEEVHYTWISYILVGGLIYLLTVSTQLQLNLITATGFFVTALLLSFVGMFLCVLGYKVIRKEGADYHTALQIRNRLYRAIGLHKYNTVDGSIFPDDELSVKDWEQVKQEVNKDIKYLINRKINKFWLKSSFKILFRFFKKDDLIEDNSIDKAKLGIRDIFQITMLLPIPVFSAALLYSTVAFVFYCITVKPSL